MHNLFLRTICGALWLSTLLPAVTVTIDFETLLTEEAVTNQFAGATFGNTISLVSGAIGGSLNEFEFPPRSGFVVVSDNGGPISIMFSTPVTSFSGYFTYAEPLLVQAFDAGSNQVATAASAFLSNMALSGVSGSPNELIQLSFAGGISGVTITGSIAGGSFTLDDVTFTFADDTLTVPEPSSLVLLLLGGIVLVKIRQTKKIISALSLIFTALALRVQAAPSVGLATVTPVTAVIGTPTPVTVQVSISDPALIPGSVNLVRLHRDGTATVLGTMRDDGSNGDRNAGDLIFTLVPTITESSGAHIQLQVTAAFRGVLSRGKSPVMSVFFQAANAPQQSITALAGYLASGNITAALQYLVPSQATSLRNLSSAGINALVSILNAATLVASRNDLRIYQAPYTTPEGTTTVEFSMIPGANGIWIIRNW